MPPAGGWKKRHYLAARKRGETIRAQGRRALYVDTVRWYAKKTGRTYQDVTQDRVFQLLWDLRAGSDREQRLLALEELGILEKDEDGHWRYSQAFMSWLFEEM